MRYLLPVAVLAGILVLFLFGLHHDPKLVPSPLIGKPAPAFDLPTIDATQPRMTLAELRGAPVLVNFFASWCEGCQVEHPYLMQLAQNQQVRLIGVDYKDAAADLRAWLQHRGDPYAAVLADLDGKTGIDWGVYGVPETFVLDAAGTIVYKQVGPLTPEAWEQHIQPLLSGARS